MSRNNEEPVTHPMESEIAGEKIKTVKLVALGAEIVLIESFVWGTKIRRCQNWGIVEDVRWMEMSGWCFEKK